MTAKEFLSTVRNKRRRLAQMNDLERKYKDMTTRATAVYRALPGGGSSYTSSLEENVTKIIDLHQDMLTTIGAYVDMAKAAEEAIMAVQNEQYRYVLRCRYLNGWSWRRIASEMRLSEVWVKQLHGYALLEVKVPEQ